MDADPDTLLHLYRAARELRTVDFQALAMSLLQSRLPFVSAVWTTGYWRRPSTGPEAPPLMTPILPMSYTLNIDPDGVSEWKQINHADKTIPVVFGNPFVAHRFHTPALFDRRDEAAVLDYTRRYGKQNALITALSPRGSQLVEWISIYRGKADHHFEVAEQMFCQALVLHLTEALKINRLVNQRAGERIDIPDSAADRIALMDPTGRMICASDSFDDICAKEWPDYRESSFPAVVIRRLLHGGEFYTRRVALRARPLADLWLLTVAPVDRCAALPPRRLAVAKLFAEGHSHKAIARSLDLAPSTVRNQIAASYHALQVSSRDGLRRILESR